MIASLTGQSWLLYIAVSSFCACCAAAGFAFIFYGTLRDVATAGVCGGLGWLVFLLCKDNQLPLTAAYASGSLVVGVAAEVFAAVRRRPATVCIVPGLIPLVPGGGMYQTMQAAVTGNMDGVLTAGFETLCAAGAIAAGIAAAAAAARLVHLNNRKI